jgi:hypothetical protein
MCAQWDQPLTPELRDTLTNLSAGLFDLDAWIKEPGKYQPSDTDLPWRKPGGKLSPADLGVIPFFENLLRESSGDDDLGVRWAAIAADPLKFSPLAGVSEWRKNRGLSGSPKFGVAASNNIWLTDANGKPISRATFYAAAWPSLTAVVAARKQAGAIDWAKLATDLLNNNAPQWPNSLQPTSGSFLVQFASDMLYAMLGQRNPVADPWRRAVLIEAGEYRTPGNSYKRAQTEAAVNTFQEVAGLKAKRRAQHGNS